MIRYTLKCANDHVFESWFQSATAFEALTDGGHLICPECGDTSVSKSLMAPQVRPARTAARAPETPDLTTPASEKETALAELRKKIESTSDYVGLNFAAEARAMHEGDSPSRSIYGEAKPEDARALLEDGVPVAPLPFTPKSKAH